MLTRLLFVSRALVRVALSSSRAVLFPWLAPFGLIFLTAVWSMCVCVFCGVVWVGVFLCVGVLFSWRSCTLARG